MIAVAGVPAVMASCERSVRFEPVRESVFVPSLEPVPDTNNLANQREDPRGWYRRFEVDDPGISKRVHACLYIVLESERRWACRWRVRLPRMIGRMIIRRCGGASGKAGWNAGMSWDRAMTVSVGDSCPAT